VILVIYVVSSANGADRNMYSNFCATSRMFCETGPLKEIISASKMPVPDAEIAPVDGDDEPL